MVIGVWELRRTVGLGQGTRASAGGLCGVIRPCLSAACASVCRLEAAFIKAGIKAGELHTARTE